MLTLLIACVFTGGWVRSILVLDQRSFASGRHSLEYVQNGDHGNFFWFHLTSDTDSGKELFDWCVSAGNRMPLLTNKKSIPFGFFWSFDIAKIESSEATGFEVTFEYWRIVIPLTLLSAFLLLTKPRKSTPKEIAAPVSNEGT